MSVPKDAVTVERTSAEPDPTLVTLREIAASLGRRVSPAAEALLARVEARRHEDPNPPPPSAATAAKLATLITQKAR